MGASRSTVCQIVVQWRDGPGGDVGSEALRVRVVEQAVTVQFENLPETFACRASCWRSRLYANGLLPQRCLGNSGSTLILSTLRAICHRKTAFDLSLSLGAVSPPGMVGCRELLRDKPRRAEGGKHSRALARQ